MQAADAAAAALKPFSQMSLPPAVEPTNAEAVDSIFALFAVWLFCRTGQIKMLRFEI